MSAPLVGASELSTAYAALGERIFKRLGIPGCDGIRDRDGVIIASQKRKRAFARTESAVQMNPSPVARSIERGRRLPAPLKRRDLIPQECERHERRGRGAHVHVDALRAAAACAPQIGGSGRIRGENRGCCLTGAKWSCDYRIASGDVKLVLI